MQETLNELLSAPLDVGWKLLTLLAVIAVLDMLRTLFRRVGHVHP
jgi:hypothetical protein